MELRQCMKLAYELRGVPVWADGSLWLLSLSPEAPADRAIARDGHAERVARLAELCDGREPFGIHALTEALGDGEATRLDAWGLRQWTHALAKMDAGKAQFLKEMKAGSRALRRFRGLDVEHELAASRERYGLMARLCPVFFDVLQPQAWPAATRECVEEWASLLLLRGRTIAPWDELGEADPIAHCLAAEAPMDAVLEAICLGVYEPDVQALAAVLLGLRQEGSPTRQQRSLSLLPGVLTPLYRQGLRRLELSPLVHAAWALEGRWWPRSTSLPHEIAAPLRRISERTYLLFGAESSFRIAMALRRSYLHTGRSEAGAKQAEQGEELAERIAAWLSLLPLYLRLLLHDPQAPKALPAAFSSRQMGVIWGIAKRCGAARLHEGWPTLCAPEALPMVEEVEYSLHAFAHDLPVSQILPCAAMGWSFLVERFSGKPEKMALFLRCQEWLQLGAQWGSDLDIEQVASCILGSQREADAALLVILGMPGREDGEDGESRESVQLVSFLQALQEDSPVLARALTRWSQVHVEVTPAEWEELLQLPGFEEQALLRYLHMRRLVGEGETFSQTILAPLVLAAKEEQTRRYLEGQLAAPDLDEEQELALLIKLERYRDPDRCNQRVTNAARRAKKSLERSLKQLERRSLEQVIEEAYRSHLAGLLGKDVPLPSPLPRALREALLLMGSTLELPLLHRFLRTVLTGEQLRDWPDNRRWQRQARASGVDVDAWLKGFRRPLEIKGRAYTMHTERDPLEALKMGSYFGTCLDLKGGCNAHSALCNTIDSNKHVVYLRDPKGHVVGRKLITLSNEGDLAGFCSYGSVPGEDLRALFEAQIQAFAEAAGLALSNSALPEDLHDMDWYDDGIEPWLSLHRPDERFGPMPEGAPQDEQARKQWQLWEAAHDDTDKRLLALIADGVSGASDVLTLRYALRDAICELPDVGKRHFYPRGLGFPTQQYRELMLYHWRRESSIDEIAEMQGLLGAVLPEPEAVALAFQTYAAYVKKRLPQLHADGQLELGSYAFSFHEAFVAASVRQLNDFVGHVWAHEQFLYHAFGEDLYSCGGPKVPEELAVALLLGAYAREGDSRALLDGLAGVPLQQKLAVKALERVVVPGAMQALRRLHKSREEEAPSCLRAMARQASAREIPWLLQLLQQHPDAFALVAAVVRWGDPAQRQEALACWQPDDVYDLLEQLEDLRYLDVFQALPEAPWGPLLWDAIQACIASSPSSTEPRELTPRLERLLWACHRLALPEEWSLASLWGRICERDPSWSEAVSIDDLCAGWDEQRALHAALRDAVAEARAPEGSTAPLVGLCEFLQVDEKTATSEFWSEALADIMLASVGEKKLQAFQLWLATSQPQESLLALVFGGVPLSPQRDSQSLCQMLLAYLEQYPSRWPSDVLFHLPWWCCRGLNDDDMSAFWGRILQHELAQSRANSFGFLTVYVGRLTRVMASHDPDDQRLYAAFTRAFYELPLRQGLPLLDAWLDAYPWPPLLQWAKAYLAQASLLPIMGDGAAGSDVDDHGVDEAHDADDVGEDHAEELLDTIVDCCSPYESFLFQESLMERCLQLLSPALRERLSSMLEEEREGQEERIDWLLGNWLRRPDEGADSAQEI